MMSTLERCVNEELLAIFPLGKVAKATSGNHCIFVLPKFTTDIAEMIWTQLILGLTKRNKIRGILDTPMIQQHDHAIIWVKNFQILCCDSNINYSTSFLEKLAPSIPASITLAIGGPAGVGKTTLIHHLASSPVGERIVRHIAYTTRPPRPHETNGVDYYFIESSNMQYYQNDPRFTGFVEARGHWYWINPTNFFKARWSVSQAIYIFSITQVHEFLARKTLAPDLQWIWLDANSDIIRQRLERRGDQNVAKSLTQNMHLKEQCRDGLVSLYINTEESIDTSLAKLLSFIYEVQGVKS
jgi:guanylate kinase